MEQTPRPRRRRIATRFLILALALAAGYAAFRPRPELVSYTTPWLTGGMEEIRVSLLMPAGWKVSPADGPVLGGVQLTPEKRADWLPEWAREILRFPVRPDYGMLSVDP